MELFLGPPASGAVALAAMSDAANLLARAAAGERGAWDELVERYSRLVWSVVRSFRLDTATAADVTQTVWLRLVEYAGRIEEPDRLPGWLATTARNEALRVSRLSRRNVALPDDADPPDRAAPSPEEQVMEADLSERVAGAFAHLDEGCRQLLGLLTLDPPLDYATISEVIGRPVGSIGPTRGRCLERLRALLAAGEAGRRPAGGKEGADA